MQRKQLILHNTLLLYGRMLFTMWLNLWATRLTLQNLGVDDLGVYGVVGSVVTMFGIFTGGITTAVQRFVTYELGRGRKGNVSGVFSTSLTLLILFSAVLVILLEVGGLWMLNHRLNIPAESLPAAQWVFQFTVVTFVANMLAIPYNALVIAHERMSAFAVISILQVVLTCIAAWSLSLFGQGRLIVYGASMAVIAVLVRLAYQFYCHRHFSEARFRFHLDRDLLRQMARFAGVSTLSGICQMISIQGLALVINMTFGVALNAVYAISRQLKNMVLSFALNLFRAIQPQITKTYAEGEFEKHCQLVYSGSKLQIYLSCFLIIPFLFLTQQILEFWLGEVPEYTVPFCQAMIFLSLNYAAFEPFQTSVFATGHIASFLLIPDVFFLLELPIAWIVARFSGNPSLMLYTIVSIEIVVCCIRVWLGSQVSVFSLNSVMRNIVLPSFLVALIDSICCWLLTLYISANFFGICLIIFLNAVMLIFIILLCGLTVQERRLIRQYLPVKLQQRFSH